MAPDKGAPRDRLDERLAEARDEALLEGEEVVGQEAGDQGQAIVLTGSRVIILKAGITATGEMDGRKVSCYPLSDITSVNVRRGPLGAVIQICIQDKPTTGQVGPPENVVVFSGPERLARCEEIADLIGKALGKPVERTQPTASEQPSAQDAPDSSAKTEDTPSKRRGGRVAKSLAEEMYAEVAPEAVQPAPSPSAAEPKAIESSARPDGQTVEQTPADVEAEPDPEVVRQTVEALIPERPAEEEHTDEDAGPEGFRPNPNLPKPFRKKSRGPSKVLVMFGGLAALVLVGVAVTTPLREPSKGPSVELNVAQLTHSVQVIRRHYNAVSNYREQVWKLVLRSNETSGAVVAAMDSGNRDAALKALSNDVTDDSWKKLSDLRVPMGLAGAQESLISGLFIRKTAVENISTGAVDRSETVRKLAEADALIKKGTKQIDVMLDDLQSRMSERSGDRHDAGKSATKPG